MPREILGSIAVKEMRFLKKNRHFRLILTHDRIMAVKNDSDIAHVIDAESGTIDRRDILAADSDNFELPYIQIRDVVMKKGGFTLSNFGRAGTMHIETFNTPLDYEIEPGQEYRSCVKLMKSVLERKVTDLSPEPEVKYCPDCRGEFQEWVTNCPDCGTALVDELPPEKPDISISVSGEDTEWDGTMVSIAVAPNEIIARMWEGLLKEQGVPCVLSSIMNIVNARYYSPGFGNYEILVKPSQAKMAFQVLQPFLDV
jgi:hypothetical protein